MKKKKEKFIKKKKKKISFVTWSYSTWARKHIKHVSKWARKHARQVGTWASKHAKLVGKWVRKHARHIEKRARKTRNWVDSLNCHIILRMISAKFFNVFIFCLSLIRWNLLSLLSFFRYYWICKGAAKCNTVFI